MNLDTYFFLPVIVLFCVLFYDIILLKCTECKTLKLWFCFNIKNRKSVAVISNQNICLCRSCAKRMNMLSWTKYNQYLQIKYTSRRNFYSDKNRII